MTPFEAVYGRAPATIHNYENGTTAVAQVEASLKGRDEILKLLKENLVTAQHRMKLNRRELEFMVGDYVYLRLQPFRQMSIRTHGHMKLSPRFYGPYQIVERLGKVAYRLALPDHSWIHSWIHPVFHVSQLKKKLGALDRVAMELPLMKDDGHLQLKPIRILDFRWRKVGKKVLQDALVRWSRTAEEDATWESFSDLQQQFPHLNLEDKIRLLGERNVMSQDHVESSGVAVTEGG